MISSKDDNATASLLGFAIANRVDNHSTAQVQPQDSSTKKDKDEGNSH